MKIFCSKLKSITQILSLSIIAIALALVVAFTNSGTVYFGYAYRLVPIYSVETKEKKVALTFDAAWGSDKTLKILDLLKTEDVLGTFFLVGFWVESNADKVKQIYDAGFDIGTHSNTHPKMSTLSKDQMKHELETSMKLISDITGQKVSLFRPPFGDYNDSLIQVAGSLGLKTIQWDVDSLDWKGFSASEILTRVKTSVKNGSIILFHNNSDHILEAIPVVVSYLKSQGYSMVKLSQLVYQDDYYIDNNGLQKQHN